MSVLIDQYMIELEDSKQNIKQAIMDKGGTITGGLSSYAESISNLEMGGSTSVLGEVTKTITDNGETTYNAVDDNLDGYSSITVNVEVPIPTYTSQSKEVTIKENGSQIITPDEGYDGLSEVEITVNVASSGGTGKPLIPNGFRFTGGDLAQVDFGAYDWSMVYDTSNFFTGVYPLNNDWSNFEQNYNGKVLSGYQMFGVYNGTSNNTTVIPQLDTTGMVTAESMFGRCSNITTIPMIDTSSVLSTNYMFYECRNLQNIPQLDTSKVTNMANMFNGCSNLQTIPLLDTSEVTNMMSMFYGCSKLTSVPNLNTSNAIDMSGMFRGCSIITTIPLLDTPNVTNINGMFYSCISLDSIPQLDLSKVTNSSYMFYECKKLSSLPYLNLSNCMNMTYMFAYCHNLESFPDMDTSRVRSIQYMYNGSGRTDGDKLTTIPQYDFSCVQNSSYGPFGTYGLPSLTTLGGFRNLKASWTGQGLSLCNNLTVESLVNFIDGLYDWTGNTDGKVTNPDGQTVSYGTTHRQTIGATNLAKLTTEQIAVATNKGWTLQ